MVLGRRACHWTWLGVAAWAAAFMRPRVAWHMVLLMKMYHWVRLTEGGLPLVLALYLGRHFQATEAVDRVFRLYGISHTKRLQQQQQEEEVEGHSDALVMATSALTVDYSMSAADAFTRTARHVIEADGDLLVLLFPREATTPTLEGLPSWVPDFGKTYSQMDFVALKEDFPSYKATGSSQSAVHPSSHEFIFALSAQKITTVEKMIPLRNIPSGAIDVELVVEFLANVEGVQIVGMDLLAGVAKALLYQHSAAAALNDEEIRAQFERWMEDMVAQRLTIDDGDVLGENYRRAVEKHFTGGMSPAQRDAETKATGDGRLAYAWDTDDGIGGMMSRVGTAELFWTSTGHIGSREVDVRPGDSVWLVPGLHLPLVLRPVANGRYRSMGRAYVHGMMRGEAFQEVRLEVIELE